MYSRLSSLSRRIRLPSASIHVSQHTRHLMYFSTTPGNPNNSSDPTDLSDALRELFTTLPEDTITTADGDNVRSFLDEVNDQLADHDVANTYLGAFKSLGNTGVHWIPHDSAGNPFDCGIINLSSLLSAPSLAHLITSKKTDRKHDEIMQSYKTMLTQMKGPNGPLRESSANNSQDQSGNASKSKHIEGSSSKEVLNDLDEEQQYHNAKITQSLCTFSSPVRVFIPIKHGDHADIKKTFTVDPTSLTDLSDHGEGVDVNVQPLITDIVKAEHSGGRYDVYMVGKFKDTLFFTSNITPRTYHEAQEEAERFNRSAKEKAIQYNRDVYDLYDTEEYICKERHHVISLASSPMLHEVPPEWKQLAEREGEADVDENEKITSILEFHVQSVITTSEVNDVLSYASTDQGIRAREVEFLLKNVIFGAVYPAPLHTRLHSVIMHDQEQDIYTPAVLERAEKLARATIATYGMSSPYACILPEYPRPIAKPEYIEQDLSLQLLYGNQAAIAAVIDEQYETIEGEDGEEDDGEYSASGGGASTTHTRSIDVEVDDVQSTNTDNTNQTK